ncbi:M48 family metallopeptidase [Jannaschia ovalis]|uniref:M48 family metallopeptidase n=1 Tax=Jannaschia ovalis TaxID=3038773 RepID=A0ABY8LBD7_9RHOB|nr:M48 family metallopeptidase [Jannaschia sp. GRR-S6-38]WGH77474.1 M48 family metallopeptidase [Jannaschia sp. GRR-S6-38]
MCQSCLNRRRFLMLAPAAAGLSGCDIELVSDAEAERMGLAAWSELRQAKPLSRNADYRETVARVAGRLLGAAGHSPGDWEFAVFADPTANAFALPGRKIGVHEGMLELAATEDQLAAVIGHEIGHVDAEHAQERMSAQVASGWGLRIVAWLLNAGDVEYAEEIAAALGLGVEVGLLRPYGREQETEADALGVRAMAAAGYTPSEAIALWQRMEAASGGRGPEFLSTHPAPQSRIEALETLIATL